MNDNIDDILKHFPELNLSFGRVNYDYCPLKITYQETDLVKLAQQLKWQGSGMEQDPYIINTSEGITQEFRILQSTLYLRFKECNFDIIWLRESRNISFEKVSFKKLVLDLSQEIHVRECTISSLSLVGAQDNYFEQSIIINGSNSRSKENKFKNCQFAEGVMKILKKGSLSPIIKYFYLFTLVLGVGFFSSLIFSDFRFTLEYAPQLFGFGGGFVLAFILCIFYWFGKVPSTNYIITDDNSKK